MRDRDETTVSLNDTLSDIISNFSNVDRMPTPNAHSSSSFVFFCTIHQQTIFYPITSTLKLLLTFHIHPCFPILLHTFRVLNKISFYLCCTPYEPITVICNAISAASEVRCCVIMTGKFLWMERQNKMSWVINDVWGALRRCFD